MIGPEEIENRFGFHKARIEGPNPYASTHAEMREEFKRLAAYIDEILPDGREKSVAFTELENASMWSHKALARLSPLEDN